MERGLGSRRGPLTFHDTMLFRDIGPEGLARLCSHGGGCCVMASKQDPSFDPKSFLAKIGEGRSIGKYRKDRIVFSQGDSADAVFYIQQGKVKVTVISEQGKEAVVAMQGPDEFCGEGCLAGQPRRMATATAMTECEIMRLEKPAILRVLREEPAFSEMFV